MLHGTSGPTPWPSPGRGLGWAPATGCDHVPQPSPELWSMGGLCPNQAQHTRAGLQIPSSQSTTHSQLERLPGPMGRGERQHPCEWTTRRQLPSEVSHLPAAESALSLEFSTHHHILRYVKIKEMYHQHAEGHCRNSLRGRGWLPPDSSSSM